MIHAEKAGAAYWVDGQPVGREAFDRSALDPFQSVIIQACAGSGKTWLLVARLLRILLAGAKPSEILAITFTRKAAGEVKARLVELLEELAAAPDERALEILGARGLSLDEACAALPRARDLLEQVLDAPVAIAIETFHGWFARIVRSAPLAAGVTPSFVLTERVGSLIAQARQMFFARLDRDETVRGAYLDLLHRVGEDAAWKLIRAMHARRNDWLSVVGTWGTEGALARLANDLGIDPNAEDSRVQLIKNTDFVTRMVQVAELLERASPSERKRAQAALTALEILKERFDDASFDQMVRLVRQRDPPTARAPTRAAQAVAKELWGPNGGDQLLQTIAGLSDELTYAIERGIDRDAYLLNRSSWQCAHAFLEIYSEIKRQQATLDFDDLEWLAATLSQDAASAGYIQTRLDARYKHVLVDEFQDTNPLQWETLKSWLEAYGDQAQKPSVFLVGDAAQSIYRFRRAESRLFAQAEGFLRSTFEARVLRTNETRRCAPAIVRVLNASLADPSYRGFQQHYTHSQLRGDVWCLEAFAPDSEASTSASLQLRDALTTPLTEPDANRHDMEAEAVARAIQGLVGQHDVQANEPGARGHRPASWRDVLVLVRKRAPMIHFERAFRAHHIPYVSDRSGGLLQTLEALDLGALLRFLVIPFSDLLLAHVLRTPIFRFGEEELVRLAQADTLGTTWWQRLRALNSMPPFDRAWQTLSRWVILAGRLPVHDLLDRIYHEGRVIECYVACAPMGAISGLRSQVRSNLLAYMELALALDSGRYPSLPRFIEQMETLAESSEQEAPDEGITDFGDTVRIMTIHGAKGLEAPIVMLTDTLGLRSPTDPNGVLIDWAPGQSAPRHFSVFGRGATRGTSRRRWFDQEEDLALQEDWNLLYVAATRAKQVLILSGVRSTRKSSENTWYERFMRGGASLLEMPRREQEQLPTGLSLPTTGIVGAPDACVPDFQPKVYPIGARVQIDDEDGDASGNARRRGIALHRVLEMVADAPADMRTAEAWARAAGLDEDAAREVVAVATRILNAPHLSRFFDSRQFQRAATEVEFLLPSGQLIRLDRVVEFEEEIWVLDYKSQASTAGAEAHRAQLACYVSAVGAGETSRRVRGGVVFSDAVLVEI